MTDKLLDFSLGLRAQRDLLLANAAAETGLADFGAPDFLDALDLLLDSIDRETGLSREGFVQTVNQISAMLASRLYSEAGWKRFPDSLSTPIRAPLIITGIVRSGTTALHKLMSVDPQFQGLEHWLCRAPQPRPPREQWCNIPAYRKAVGLADDMMTGAPEMKSDHMMSADEVDESIFLLPQTFVNNTFPSQWYVPTYDDWYMQQDETPSYLRLGQNLQLIGANEPDRRWLLKNPTDLLAMDALLNAFPDALIVQTHRDPVQAIPSISNILTALHRMYAPGIEPERVGRRESELWATALERAEAAYQRLQRPVFNVEFGDFIADQLGTVKAIYRYFDLDLKPEVEAEMQRWLDGHPRNSATLQRFQPEGFGLTADEIRNRYADYRKRRGYP
ncbi:sulfotransferase [Novosphingobium colocasiae]|uniref:sulfotransferase family protein n=1 Tax=Novosphingobium colocasiae TaxID=1256513 RepID=UPI0035AF3569